MFLVRPRILISFRFLIWTFFFAGLIAACNLVFSALAQTTSLAVSQPIERALSAGEVHQFKLELMPEQYAQLTLRPMQMTGFDLFAEVLNSDGASLVTTANTHAGGRSRTLALIAPTAGNYQINVRASALSSIQTGNYEIKLSELRFATQTDRWRLSAEKAESDALNANTESVENVQTFRIAKFQEALGYWQQSGDRKNELRVLNLLSHNFWLRGDLASSQTCRNQALVLARAENDRYAEGNLLIDSALLSGNLGRYQEAMTWLHQAREIFKERKSQFAEGIALFHLGYICLQLGDDLAAELHLQESLKKFTALGFTFATSSPLNELSRLHQRRGESQKAIELALSAREAAKAGADDEQIAQALKQLGDLYLQAQELHQATTFNQEFLAMTRKMGRPSMESVALLQLGRIALQSQDYEQAADSFQQSLQIARSISAPAEESAALFGMARVQMAKSLFGTARQTLEEVLAFAESTRANLVSPNLRQSYFATTQNAYALYLDALMQNQPSMADAADSASQIGFAVSERARARSLLDLLAEASTLSTFDSANDLVAQEKHLRQLINAKAVASNRALDQKQSAKVVETLQSELNELLVRYEEAQTSLRQNHPRYVALTKTQPLGLTEIQKELLDNDTVLLAYAFGQKSTYLWAVTPNTCESYTLASREPIQSTARRLHESLSKDAKTDWQSPAQELGRFLLSPLAPKLQQEWRNKRLVIVAPETLQYIPFGILPLPNAQTSQTKAKLISLLERHEVVSLASASSLALLRQELANRKAAPQAVAIFADPVFAIEDARVKSAMAKKPEAPSQGLSIAALERAVRSVTNTDRASLQRLPFSRDEAEAIAAIAPAGSVLKALDFQASRATALSDKLAEYRIVHFATHGLLDSAQPELSGLALSLVDEQGKPQDGYLRLNEIYNLKLNAELVVLSACQTGLGKEVKGEGLVGLTRGFMYAGAPRVVASLWQVNDAATAELMKRFYRGMLKEKLRPAAALRQAQLELMKKPAWRSPYYWGAFVLQGEWK